MKKPTAGRCAVVRIEEVRGPKRGLIQVLFLRCGGWISHRARPSARPPMTVFCIACYVRKHLAAELAAELAAARTTANGRPH